MLFTAVTELFGHLAQLPALDEAFEALRRGSPAEKLAGLTNPVKALVVALAAAELRRPIVVLVEDERRAASILEPLQFFQRTLSGNSAGPVLLLPALDKLPGLGAGPHPEILEERASTLSRYVSGQSSIIVAPIEASLLGFAPTEFYESLSLSLERDAEISACAAEYWMFFLLKRLSLCVSSFWEIRWRPCANLIRRRSALQDRLAARFCHR
jgi:hypothetical protein